MERTGSPPGLLQDDSRKLSRWLATRPGARRIVMVRVIEIVKERLMAGGFDGLIQEAAACGCELHDLNQCGDSFATCEPAYRGADKDSPGDWAMYRTKEAAEASKTPNVGANRSAEGGPVERPVVRPVEKRKD